MKTAQLLAGALAALSSQIPLSAQCSVQELHSLLPDNSHFGNVMAVSGSRLIVGARDAGVAYIFDETGGVWDQTFRLSSPNPGLAHAFGSQVAVDGDTAVVGDWGHVNGAAHVFVKSGGGWLHQATLEPSDGTNVDYFGTALALDGERLAVGSNNNLGSAYIFERTGGVWQQTDKLTLGTFTFFADSLALHGDTLLIGDPGDPDKGFNAGACYVYEHDGTNWVQESKLVNPNGFDDGWFGASVAFENGTAVIGEPAFFNPNRRGSGHVFDFNSVQWVHTKKLFGRGSPLASQSGYDVSIESDCIVMRDAGDSLADLPGSVYIYRRDAGEWRQSAKLRRPGGDDSYDGFASAVAQRGDQVFVGSPLNGAGVETGVVYVFDTTLAQDVPYCQSSVNSSGQASELASVGSHDAGVDDFTLIARDVPPGQGFFLIGDQATQAPLWDGVLCVARPFARTALASANNGGDMLLNVELSSLPFAITAGSSWNFQAWFTDAAAGATGANLSSAVTVTFCP